MENPYKNNKNNKNIDNIKSYLETYGYENLTNIKKAIKPIIELEKSKRNELINNETDVINNIDTNIKNYTVEDIFDLLNIDINSKSDYETVKKDINEKIDIYISFFEKNNNVKMTDFFKEIRTSLFGNLEIDKNVSEAERLLILYEEKYNAEKNNAEKNKGFKRDSNDTTNEKFFDSTSGPGNPINRKTITKLLNVDSRFRKNYDFTSSTDYTIDLPYPINNVIEMKLSDLEFPTTHYPFNDSYENNYLWIKITVANNVNTYMYLYVNEGNYYHLNLIEDINRAFTDNGISLQIFFNLDYSNPGGIGNGDGHVMIGLTDGINSSYGTGTSNTNVTGITNVELNFYGSKLTSDVDNYKTSQIFNETYHSDIINRFYNTRSNINYRQRMGWLLGFRKEYYTGSLQYKTEGVLDILGPKYLYLILDDFNTSNNINFLSSSEKSLLRDNIIARISVKGYSFSIQSQTDLSIFSEPRYYYGPVDINRFRILVVDEYGRILDMNNMDFSFTLILTTIYSKT